MKKLIGLIEEFEPFRDGRDERWTFFLKEKRRWLRLSVTRYDGVYYFSGSGFDAFSCPGRTAGDTGPVDRFPAWAGEISRWRRAVAGDPVEAQARLFRALPLGLREGVIARKNVRLLLPGWMPIASELSKKELKDILEILRKPAPESGRAMTLDRFLEYCRVAYQANPSTFKRTGFRPGLSGREYYKRYADGRHDGLLDIAPRSAEAFARWYKRGSRGGHPWEIYRGGNSTHIDMYVVRRDIRPGGWEIHLRALSSTRMIETCRIAAALARAGLPFIVDDARSYIDRLLDQDWVGIIPRDEDVSYAWQSFPAEWGVRDCVRLEWFYEGSSKPRSRINARLRAVAHWLPQELTAFLRRP
ncbi:MAG: Uncharacterized protein FD189_1361 [Elusimicrobia bacterium]|nr:MAG: Uncharacterized protein FD154_1135 [Elusimicrobiota bacterium]KAF0155561.1 MAG: Uncharacterized protein FD189_1361 [Elusimicrobiota bacterium]